MEKIALGCGPEPNIALGFDSCYINLSTAPLSLVSYHSVINHFAPKLQAFLMLEYIAGIEPV